MDLAQVLVAIVLIDLALSADNALLIGMAALLLLGLIAGARRIRARPAHILTR